MSRSGPVAAVYGAGVLQGLALVIFPAAAPIFLAPSGFGLGPARYGALFVPQAAAALGCALLGAAWADRLGPRRLLSAGLAADFLAMALLVGARFAPVGTPYPLLLGATGCLGVGFGLAVPALNTLAAGLHPRSADRAVLVLNALLGLGTALAPLLVAAFTRAGAWWGLPALTAAALLGLLPFAATRAFPGAAGPTGLPGVPRPFPRGRYALYAAFALLYGLCETLDGTWAVPYLGSLGVAAGAAAMGLAAFWGMVTLGRIGFAALGPRFPPARALGVLPAAAAALFLAAAALPRGGAAVGIACFALAGLALSSLLPLALSLVHGEVASAGAVAGLIACYQAGCGAAAFGVAPLRSATGLGLGALYALTAPAALGLFLLGRAMVRGPLGGGPAAEPVTANPSR